MALEEVSLTWLNCHQDSQHDKIRKRTLNLRRKMKTRVLPFLFWLDTKSSNEFMVKCYKLNWISHCIGAPSQVYITCKNIYSTNIYLFSVQFNFYNVENALKNLNQENIFYLFFYIVIDVLRKYSCMLSIQSISN